ncbi:ATP-binding protein [Streptomyces sp. NPDC058434]|uniref:ATP-binding protein n=1 Tax=Streptomyces sp. NPDC058434 TaxID=3346498 RepID=UPI00365D0C64
MEAPDVIFMTPLATAPLVGREETVSPACAMASVPSPQGPIDTATPCVWALPHRPEASRAARRIVRIALTSWGIDEDSLEQALLVVSELVTNAVEHALPPVALHLTQPACDGTVHIEVDDGGPAAVEGAWTASCSDEEHGRGSGIIDFLAVAHGTRCGSRGATHWVDLATSAT